MPSSMSIFIAIHFVIFNLFTCVFFFFLLFLGYTRHLTNCSVNCSETLRNDHKEISGNLYGMASLALCKETPTTLLPRSMPNYSPSFTHTLPRGGKWGSGPPAPLCPKTVHPSLHVSFVMEMYDAPDF